MNINMNNYTVVLLIIILILLQYMYIWEVNLAARGLKDRYVFCMGHVGTNILNHSTTYY